MAKPHEHARLEGIAHVAPCGALVTARRSRLPIPLRRRHAVRLVLGGPLLLSLSACAQFGPVLAQDGFWMWLGGALAGCLILGTSVIGVLTWRSLRNWNLAKSALPTHPLMYGSVVLAAAGAFVLYNFLTDFPIPPEQRIENSIGWVIGSILGGVAAYHGGKHLAAWRYRRKFPVDIQEKT